MFASKIVLALAASTLASASIMQLAERQPIGAINKRTILQGWSLQSSTCPSDSTTCGSASCCPSSTFCNTAGNSEVPACCSEDSDCRGAVEGAPSCADSTWSLWKGLNGNGFCCEVGLVGIYDYHNAVAGTCVATAAADATTAVLQSTGSGSKATSAASKATSTPASVKATSTSAPAVEAAATSTATSTAVASATASGTSAAPRVAAGNGTTSTTTGGSATNGTVSGASNGTSTSATATPTGAAGHAQAGVVGVLGAIAFALML